MAFGTPTLFRGNMNSVDVASGITGATQVSNLIMRQFVDFQKYLDPTETPFTSSIGTGPQATQKKIEWLTGYLVPNVANLAGGGIADGSTTTVNVATGDGGKFMITQEFKVLSTGENMWVTNVNGDALTVVRGYGGTTPAAAAGGAKLQLMATAAVENVASPLAPVAKGTTEYNLPRLMDQALLFSERSVAIKDYEVSGNQYDWYLAKKMKEVAILFEVTAIHARRTAEAGGVAPSAAARPSSFGGLLQFTSRSYDLLGQPLNEFNLETMMGDVWEGVGDGNVPRKLYVGRFMRQALNSLFNAQRYADVKDDVTNLTWRRVETTFGPIDFVLSRYIPAGMAVLCDPSDIKKHQMGPNGGWREVKLPAMGPYVTGRFTGDYSLSFPRDQCRAIIVNASTTASDYTNMI